MKQRVSIMIKVLKPHRNCTVSRWFSFTLPNSPSESWKRASGGVRDGSVSMKVGYAPERKRSSNYANERDDIFAYISVPSMTNSYRLFFLRNMS